MVSTLSGKYLFNSTSMKNKQLVFVEVFNYIKFKKIKFSEK